MQETVELIVKMFPEILVNSHKTHEEIVVTKNNRQIFFKVYPEYTLIFDGINDPIRTKSIQELEQYICSC